MEVKLVSNLLEANDLLARKNRENFRQRGLFVINLMSAPGAGKTTILEKTIRALSGEIRIGVVEGDIVGTRDAERVQRLGVPVVQINTGGACHLDAGMIARALEDLNLEGLEMLIVENVGNLVCPAEFDVGEDAKVMVLSVTEGHDKPGKYPLMFRESRVLLVNKTDLLPFTDFDMAEMEKDVRGINPAMVIFPMAAKRGEGIEPWANWLKDQAHKKRNQGF
ncbi:MAG: hydrogenase nickel incorporation protein HypB [Firmicutes bacterium]|nr:hydrogenase nickel incorporation protein HypB [Bacillota bacterium]